MKRLRAIVVNIVQEVTRTNVAVYAANAAFFLFLSVFPAVLVLISITQYTVITMDGVMALISPLIPEALMPLVNFVIRDLSAVNPAKILSISTILLLWSASKGVYSLVQGMNQAFHLRETRSYLRVRLLCIIYIVGVLAAILITVVLYTTTQSFLNWLLPADSLLLDILSALVHYRWFVAGVVLLVFFTGVYAIFPCKRNNVLDVLPGSLAATVGWLLFSSAYSHYVRLAGGASSIYGGISIIAFTMLWLYLVMNILLYGAMFSHYLIHQKSKFKQWLKK